MTILMIKNSEENVFRLKDNIEYRLFSASHQYLLLLKELGAAELYLQNIYTIGLVVFTSGTA